MSGQERDICDQAGCIYRNEVLVEYDHCLLRTEIHVCDFLGVCAYFHSCEGCGEGISAFEVSALGVEYSLCNFLQEAQVVCVDFLGHIVQLLRELTHACVDAGASAIFGGGTHQLRPLEIYNGAPIFYSLGDFIFQGMRVKYLPADFMEKYGVADDATAWEGLMARSKGGKIGLQAGVENFLTVVPRLRFENGEMASLEMLPVDLAFKRRDFRNGLPRRARGATAREIFNRLSALSVPFGTKLRLERGLIRAL